MDTRLIDTTPQRLVELISSHICHELAGSLGAAAQSFELIQQGKEEFCPMLSEVLDLAMGKLRTLRCLFGVTSQEIRSFAHAPHKLSTILAAQLRYDNVTVSCSNQQAGSTVWWNDDDALVGRILLAGTLVATAALPRGGRVTLSQHDLSGPSWQADGESVILSEPTRQALVETASPAPDKPEVKTIVSWYAGALVGAASGYWHTEKDEKGVLTLAVFPKTLLAN